MRRFNLLRHADATGVSGTGLVAEGVVFTKGKVAITWLGRFSTVTVYDGLEAVEGIHLHGGQSEIVWVDDEAPEPWPDPDDQEPRP